MKSILLLILAFVSLPSLLLAEWKIEQPTKEIPKKLTGEIFGRTFKVGEAEWSDHALTISSDKKMGGWPESKLIIFLKKEKGEREWLVTPQNSGFGDPHIHMKFGKEGSNLPGTLMFTSEYCMHLKLIEEKGDTATFQIHLSLPDYKKSFLLGTFKAKIKA